jgi:hypothetical protein
VACKTRYSSCASKHEVVTWPIDDAVESCLRWWEESKRKCQEWVEELTLLQAWGSELCQAIVGHPRVRSHLSEGMRITTLHHAEMAKQLAVLRATVSSIMEFMLVHD